MRVVQAAALTTAALLLASFASAQGLGSAAAREREKRKTTTPTSSTPAKVYKDGDLGSSVAPVAALPDLPLTADEPAASPGDGSTPPAEGQPAAEGQPLTEGQPAAPEAAAKPTPAAAAAAKAEADRQAEAQAAWKRRLDQARKEELLYKDLIDKVQLELNDTSVGLYSPARLGKVAFLEENKQKLAEVQGRIASLEAEGRRSDYR